MNNKSGFTLIEVIIFSGLISIVFFSSMSLIISSLRDAKINQNKIMASHKAQNLQEWIRFEKENNWVDFLEKSSAVGNVYCFNSEPINDWGSLGQCSDFSLANSFKRELTLTLVNEETESGSGVYINKIISKITTSWIQGNNVYKIETKSLYTQWE